MRLAICYVSSAASNLTKRQIDDLLRFTEEKNNRNNLSGIFLFSEGNFFQILEGEKEHVQALFKKIESDPRHTDLIIIFQKELAEAKFNRYKSSFVSADTRFSSQDMESYLSQVESFDPPVRTTVRYILQKFTEGSL